MQWIILTDSRYQPVLLAAILATELNGSVTEVVHNEFSKEGLVVLQVILLCEKLEDELFLDMVASQRIVKCKMFNTKFHIKMFSHFNEVPSTEAKNYI